MRTLTAINTAQLNAGIIRPVFFVMLTFNSGTVYACTTPFNVTWGGNTWNGVGDLGKVGTISEGIDVTAQGTTVVLSGIDNALLTDCLSDVGALLPAAIYLGFMSAQMGLLDTPTQIFGGVVDSPEITVGPDHSTITLSLENKLLNLQRGTMRRWTAEDQHRYYADDTAFGWVPTLSNLALVWG